MQSKLNPLAHDLGSSILILQFITLLILKKKITPLIPNSHKSTWAPVICHSLSKTADFISYVTKKGHNFFSKKLFLTLLFVSIFKLNKLVESLNFISNLISFLGLQEELYRRTQVLVLVM